MAKSDTQTQQQSQNSVTSPWAPAIPQLQNLLTQYGSMNPGVTPAQTAALSALTSGTQGITNFGSDASGAVGRLFNSDTAPQIGMLNTGYGNLQKSLNPIADPSNLNPYNTPGFSDALKTMTSDITNQVKGVYAGSGRDPSGAGSFAQSLGRGLTQGEAPTIANQYNANVGNLQNAATTLFGGAGSTAGGITNQQQVPLTNALQAIGAVPAAAGAYTAPGATALNAANAAYAQPFQNLGLLASPLTSIAGLGGESTGTGTSTTTQPQNIWSNLLGGALGASALVGKGGLFPISDKRAKTDIKKVGMLHDGQPVVRYRLKSGGPMQIGLLAQSVQKKTPHAVHKIGGMLSVDYGAATDKAANMEAA